MFTPLSSSFNNLVQTRNEAKQIRFEARAKEAKAINLLLRNFANKINESTFYTRLQEIESELLEHEQIIRTDDPSDLLPILSSVTVTEYCQQLAETLPKRFKLKDVIHSSNTQTNHLNIDTRHQDAKDIERDQLIIGNDISTPLYGSNIGYDGAVEAISQNIAECGNLKPINNQGIIRFSRVLINAVNRTTSGGDAFEAIIKFIKHPDFVEIAPDTRMEDPLKITCWQTAFKTQTSWEWGIRARTEATTRYLLYHIDDIERLKPIISLKARCVREFGLPLPLPAFNDSRYFQDDGKSMLARKDFECDDGGILEISGTVLEDRRDDEKFKKVFGDD